MSQKFKVLILDDEQDILNVIERFLNRRKLVEVLTCTNPIDAIELIKNGDFKMLLTDIMMPEMNGVDVLKEVVKSRPEVKVIMMTAYSTIDKILECDKIGAVDYVTKPFISLKDIESKILDHLDIF
ncbi:MAG: response regulator [Arcobacteraceae bacterium]|jgi:DNA-binding NtrC family response regulator|nr:response regulator [Arcobacteraceae bacterium]